MSRCVYVMGNMDFLKKPKSKLVHEVVALLEENGWFVHKVCEQTLSFEKFVDICGCGDVKYSELEYLKTVVGNMPIEVRVYEYEETGGGYYYNSEEIEND